MEIDKIRVKVKELMKDVPPHHGYEHAEIVASWAAVIAFLEKGEAKNAQIAGLLHDLRKWNSEEYKARKIKVNWGTREESANPISIIKRNKNGILRNVGCVNVRKKLFGEPFPLIGIF